MYRLGWDCYIYNSQQYYSSEDKEYLNNVTNIFQEYVKVDENIGTVKTESYTIIYTHR